MEFLGADESLVMRTVVSWAWFRPSEEAWDKGARWYRCDIVGGGEQSEEYVDLPETAGASCAAGRRQVDGLRQRAAVPAGQDPCTRAARLARGHHDQGRRDRDPYPGDRLVEVTTRDYCSDSVGRLAGLPARVRLRLHVVPRGRVGGRQPPLGLLGEDRP